MSDESLSSKIFGEEDGWCEIKVISVKDVKEAVQKLKDLFDETRKDERYNELFEEIDKIFGEKLT